MQEADGAFHEALPHGSGTAAVQDCPYTRPYLMTPVLPQYRITWGYLVQNKCYVAELHGVEAA